MDMTTFMQRVLEPRPPEELVDIQYNSILRHARDKKWRMVEAKRRYYKALLDLEIAKLRYINWVEKELPAGVEWNELLHRYVQATAEQILLPAPDRAALRWKKAQSYADLPLESDEVAAAISRDEAWLVAHPTRINSRSIDKA